VTFSDDGTGNHTLKERTELIIDYNKKSATVTSSSSMPWNGLFDEFLREQMVMHAKAKREGQVGQPENIYQPAFRKRAMEENLRRNHYLKNYYIDF
jgi:hypothetical protein